MTDMTSIEGSLGGEIAALENSNMVLGGLEDSLEGQRGYAKARRKVAMARQKLLDALHHLYDAEQIVEDRRSK